MAKAVLSDSQQWLIINALREKAEGDREAADSSSLNKALHEQADQCDELADAIEMCTCLVIE